MAPEHRRLSRYGTMTMAEIYDLPVAPLADEPSHLYLWVPNALLPEGLEVMRRWGFSYKTNLVWYKIRRDGGPDGRGVGFYFRNVTELILFGVRGSLRTLKPGRTQVNLVSSCKREHSRKPDLVYDLVERCSPGPYLELFARHSRDGWDQWGDELPADRQAGGVNGRARESHEIRSRKTRSIGIVPGAIHDPSQGGSL
jgi:N6-adenosine-specific RNA methylase IME4